MATLLLPLKRSDYFHWLDLRKFWFDALIWPFFHSWILLLLENFECSFHVLFTMYSQILNIFLFKKNYVTSAHGYFALVLVSCFTKRAFVYVSSLAASRSDIRSTKCLALAWEVLSPMFLSKFRNCFYLLPFCLIPWK